MRAAYPGVRPVRANLVALPYAGGAFDLVVSLQTIEHLWEQPRFVAECPRVLAAGGELWLSTPDRRTFPPGNWLHARELDPAELAGCSRCTSSRTGSGGSATAGVSREWEERYGDPVAAQLAGPPQAWPAHVAALVRSVAADDFELVDDVTRGCLDLVAVVLPA